MASYLLWMMRYSEAIRQLLEPKVDASNMSYEQMLSVLERPENISNHRDLADFLEGLGKSHLSIEERVVMLKKNYNRFFKGIAA